MLFFNSGFLTCFVQLVFSYPVDLFSGYMSCFIQVVTLSCQYTLKISINRPGHFFSHVWVSLCFHWSLSSSVWIVLLTFCFFLDFCLHVWAFLLHHPTMYNCSFALRQREQKPKILVSRPYRDQGLHWLKYLSVFCVNSLTTKVFHGKVEFGTKCRIKNILLIMRFTRPLQSRKSKRRTEDISDAKNLKHRQITQGED